MSYKLYTDKPNKFTCNIQVDGTSLSNSRVRLVVESEDMTYLFNGTIYENGVCEVSVPKTKTFLPENKRGNMRLEVIADDVFFEPWSSAFIVETNKKVAVVVQEQEEVRPTVRVEMVRPVESKPKLNEKVSPKPSAPIQEKKIVKKPVNNSNGLSKKDLLDILKGK